MSGKIGIWFDEELFSSEAKMNTQRRINEMLEEFKEYREWELRGDEGIFRIEGYNDLVVVRDIEFMSFCEHHLLPFSGVVHIAYLPRGYILGVSKFARIVKKFASMPQLQERMTEQIADYLFNKIQNVVGVMVIVEAEHMCMKWRGIKNGARMITHAIRGTMPKDEVMAIVYGDGR